MSTLIKRPIQTRRRLRQITYVLSAVTTDKAGTESHLLRLMRRLDRRCFQPTFVVLQRSPWTDRFRDPTVPLHVLRFKSFRRPQDWFAIEKLARLFKRNGTDVVELHSIDAHFVGALAAHIAKVPCVISCRRDLGHHYGIKSKLLMQLGNRFVNRFVANSRIVADTMSRIERIPRERFEVIHNGIDIETFDRQSAETVSPEFEARVKTSRVVAICANLLPVKNHLCFLRAAKAIAIQFNDVMFAVMGDGPLRDGLESQAEKLGIADRVVWLGSVPRVAPYLVRAQVGCLSSNSEGFSNAVIEYMAAGLPVVATDVGGVSEAVIPGQTGHLVARNSPEQLANKIIEVLSMPELERQKWGNHARTLVETEFSFRHMVESFESFYHRQFLRSEGFASER